jgi:hypothetical protein
MTAQRTGSADSGMERLAKARASQLRDEHVQRDQATRTVDSHAIDQQDRAMLMAMLGLDARMAAELPATYVGPIN